MDNNSININNNINNSLNSILNDGHGLIAEEVQSNILIPKEYPEYVKEKFNQIKDVKLEQCPTIGEYKTVIGNDIFIAIEGYFKFIKKSLKVNKIPKKQQVFFEKTVACHLLTELTYHAFKTGWEWGKNSNNNNNDNNIDNKEELNNNVSESKDNSSQGENI